MTTKHNADGTVTHRRGDYSEGYDQPNDTWTHDGWYMAYCPLCEKDGHK